jgi:hypothetical protein
MTTRSEFRHVLSKLIAMPEDAVTAIETIGELAAEASGEVESAWQSRSAGKPWRLIARTVFSATHRILKGFRSVGYIR